MEARIGAHALGRGGSRAHPDSGSNDGLTYDPNDDRKAVQVSVHGVTNDLPVSPVPAP